jgi:fructokinase
MQDKHMWGAIDAGGTSWRCAIGHADNHGPVTFSARTQFATTLPEETIKTAAAFFQEHHVNTIGMACFGPLAVDEGHQNFGHILTTSKPFWSNFNVVGRLAELTGASIAFDTDVNAAALAEQKWGAGRGLNDLAYVTVGTGIGAGILSNGRSIRGALHPEIGHILPPRHQDDLNFEGVCRFHGGCYEGLASAPALKVRWGASPETLDDDHPAWNIEAFYLAHLCSTLLLSVAPLRIILGGGVMARKSLLGRVHDHLERLLCGYTSSCPQGVEELVVLPDLGLDAGLLGGLALAMDAQAARIRSAPTA